MSSLLVNTPPGSRSNDVSFYSLPASPEETRVDQLVSRLEEACVRVTEDEGISTMQKDPTSAVYVPLRVKEIVQDCLTPSTGHSRRSVEEKKKGEKREVVRYLEMWKEGGQEEGEGGVRVRGGMKEEGELESMREHLAVAQRQNEELSLKYIAVSEKVEEIFKLQAEVSSLTYQLASLREDNSQLQHTLFDQETAFSYALRNCNVERVEREQKIGRLEEQLKQCQTRCGEMELELRTKTALAAEETSHLTIHIRKLEQELEHVKNDSREVTDRLMRESKESTKRTKGEFERELERVKREGQEEVEMVRRREKEEALKMRRQAEELEKAHHQELRVAVERAETGEQKVAELSLLSEHLQQQLAESQTAGSRLSEDVNRLSLTLNHTHSRLRDMENEHHQSFISVREQSVRSQQASLSLALRDVSSARRELSLLSQTVQSHLESGGREVKNTAERLRTLLQQMTALHYSESKSIRERLRETVAELVSTKRRMEGEVQRAEAEVEEMTQREAGIVQSKLDLKQEVEELKSKNASLMTEVSQQLLSLEKVQSNLESAQCERDQLTKEVSSLTECLRQCKAALKEMQQQHNTLTTTVTTVAEEKADIMREKLSLEVQVGTLEDTCNSLKTQLDLVSIKKEQLEKKVTDSEKRLFLAELNRHVLSGSMVNTSIEESSPSQAEVQQDASWKILDEYKPLCDTLTQMKKRELELLEQLETCRLNYETQLQTIQEEHRTGIASIKKQHEETCNAWRCETEKLRKSLQEQQQQSQLKDAELEVARKRNTECTDECAKWQSEVAAVQNLFKTERERLSEIDQKLQELTLRNANLTEKLNSHQLQLEEVHKEKESLREDKTHLLKAQEDLSATVEHLEDENRTMKELQASADKELEECQTKLEVLGGENDRLRQSLQHDEENCRLLEEKEAQLAEIQRCYQQLEREKREVESTLLAAQNTNSSLESQLLAIKTDMSSVTSQLETCQIRHNESQTNYGRLLAQLEQVLGEDQRNPLHTTEGSLKVPVRAPEAVYQALLKLKNERDQFRVTAEQNAKNLQQTRKDFEHLTEEKSASDKHVQDLQLSLTSLQAKFDEISRQCESSNKQAKLNIDALQVKNRDLQLQNGSLQRQLDSMKVAEKVRERKCFELEQRMREMETVRGAGAEEFLQLQNTVSILKSSQVNKERKLAETEERLKNTQREVLEREVAIKTVERTRLVLEQRLAVFEQGSVKQENTKRELQSQVQYLESQLTEIQEKSQRLRRSVEQLQKENSTLSGDVEHLSMRLETTIQEKQTLTQSHEKEIDRLRVEVDKLLQENSNLKVQLVH